MSQMCTDILGHPPSLCNCRRVWHPCHTHAATKLSSHRIHRIHRNLLLRYPPTDVTDAHRYLGHSPSLCTYRRVWHPCHTHATYQGVQWSPLHQPSKKCTNKAATASSHSKRLLCILRVPWDNTTQPKHLCASVPSVGGLLSGWRGYGRDAIPS